jgi:ubiquinone/menaquinone biosynthesis C-methylase UbiE
MHSIQSALRGAMVIGIDISEEGIKEGIAVLKRMEKLLNIYFIVADLRMLPIKEKSFSKAICVDVLEHINEDYQALSEIRRVLRPYSICIIHVPQERRPRILIRRRLHPKFFGHVREGYNLEHLNRILGQQNLVTIKAENTFKNLTYLT